MVIQRFPGIKWDFLMENVSSMDLEDAEGITTLLNQSYPTSIVYVDACEVGRESSDLVFTGQVTRFNQVR